MRLRVSLGILGIGLLILPANSFSQEQTTVTPPPQTSVQGHIPAFPPSDKCSTSTPCRNVEGEIVKIEESYWIQQPNGTQTHIRVKPHTKIESRVKVGDAIAAQVTSSGDAEAIIRMKEMPKSVELPVPSKELSDMR
jgi:hypothetical protein